MIIVDIQNSLLSYEECRSAMQNWTECRSSFSEIKKIIAINYVFNLSKDSLEWMRNIGGKSSEFCAGIGIHKEQLILILYPLDSGKRIEAREYPVAFLSELTRDVMLQEIKEYTIVKNAVLSRNLEPMGRDADMAFPVSDKPILEQDKALEAIDKWRLEGMDWFYRECGIEKGSGIFRKFYVPTADLCLSDEGLTDIVCSFGLKYNDIYGKMLATLIFISFHENLENTGGVQTISNTYDWAKPCPPICRLPDDGVGNEF